MSEPGWHPDPSGRFERRYFDGTRWTEHVSTGDRPGIDPLEPRPPAPTAIAFVSAYEPSGNGLAVAGFVLALIGLLFGFIPITYFLAWILGGLGLVLAAVGLGRTGKIRRDNRKGLAIAGVVLGIAALGMGVVGVVILAEAVDELGDEIEAAFGDIDALSTDPLAVGDKQTFEDGSSIQTYSYEQPVPPVSDFLRPSPGFEYGVVDVEVCAGASQSAGYNPFAFTARLPDNRIAEPAFGDAREPALSSGQARRSTCVRGFVTLEVPTGQRPVELVWDYDRREAVWSLD